MREIKGAKYIGEVPKVLVQAPIMVLKRGTAYCTGCDNIVEYADYDKFICPICATKQITNTSGDL